jgi:ferredoxin
MAMARVNPDFASEIKKYGAKEFDACYNCGTCTAICGLTEQKANFPRIFIRQGMLGQKNEILDSKELWLCYACGDCTSNCPREAAPGDYMAAMRRYAISRYEPTGLTRLMFKSNPIFILITLFFAVLLGFFLFTMKPEYEVARWIFNLIPYAVIHTMGIVIFSFTGLSMLWGLISMVMHMSKKAKKDEKSKTGFFKALFGIIGELLTMKRYKDCDTEEDSFWKSKPWFRRPWFVHWSIMWGFIGLLLATILDFILKDPATDIWWPSRILGTIAGLLMVYGTSIAIFYRINKITKAYAETKMADWMLLIFLWFAGVTGFWLEISVALNAGAFFNQIVMLIHTVISMELVLLFSFSKFAHALYRPIALYFFNKS